MIILSGNDNFAQGAANLRAIKRLADLLSQNLPCDGLTTCAVGFLTLQKFEEGKNIGICIKISIV